MEESVVSSGEVVRTGKGIKMVAVLSGSGAIVCEGRVDGAGDTTRLMFLRTVTSLREG